jgi:P-type E1-E2 ATPase
LKHKSDNQTNNTGVRILREGHFQLKKWKDIKVGDIIEVTSDSPFPCDLVLLYSKTSDGVCYITTANLDGETNLKVSLPVL